MPRYRPPLHKILYPLDQQFSTFFPHFSLTNPKHSQFLPTLNHKKTISKTRVFFKVTKILILIAFAGKKSRKKSCQICLKISNHVKVKYSCFEKMSLMTMKVVVGYTLMKNTFLLFYLGNSFIYSIALSQWHS